MLVFHSLSAVTTELPAGVVYGVSGSDLELTCKTTDPALTKFEFYHNENVVQSLSATSTYTITAPTSSEDGEYYCVAADGSDKRSAETTKQTIAFKSKSFLINHLKDKYGDL